MSYKRLLNIVAFILLALCWMTTTVYAAKPTIYVLDLNYIHYMANGPRYDIAHVASCVQGLVNRDAPRVFIKIWNDPWYDRVVESGGLCEGWKTTDIGLGALIDLFRDRINGVVLYDGNTTTGVISTSLVATTVAGVENGIAVRKDTSAGSMYNYLVNDADGPKLPVLFDLTGKFTGTGTIWQTSTPSTGSAKCDAYIWAKEKYIDTGKCDPTVLLYTLDLWGIDESDGLRSQLFNLDYAIKKKGFCFELSPWADEAPNDDPTQTLGADRNTLLSILNACNTQTGQKEMIKLCGFLNWDIKYTNVVTRGTPSIHTISQSETTLNTIFITYNAYIEGDAPLPSCMVNASFNDGLLAAIKERRYIQNPPPTYSDMVAQGLIDGNGNVVEGNYNLIRVLGYDGPAWASYTMSAYYADPNRGNVNMHWELNSNLMDRGSVQFDYYYRHKTPKDFFCNSYGGAGVVCPSLLYGTRSPSGYPSIVDVWIKHNKDHNRLVDYSIAGWLANPAKGNLSTADYETAIPAHGDGIGAGVWVYIASPFLLDNVPIIGWTNTHGTETFPDYPSGVHFNYWTSAYSPSDVKVLEDSYADSPNNHRFLDMYTFNYLLRYYLGGSNNYRTAWVSDTIPRIMALGQTYPVTIAVRNDGWDTWSEASSYRLGYAIVPSGTEPNLADYNAKPRILIPGGESVLPGATVMFTANIAAPATGGKYDLYYDMVQDGVAWFREKNNIEWKKEIIVSTNETYIDTDNDGASDVYEQANGLLYWHPDDYCSIADINCDGKVDTKDLFRLAENWLK
ncbi:MAG: hypothetical protein A2Y10_10250 [Planctomycetes bacterium GWF2_41_51]|nr:MAG: hypothetical protein A2Y10_10250 [Planctomycetes bacterium GWF2_41_51]HBG27678.1 hypothetical protein [Phycisphaerales bacterium]